MRRITRETSRASLITLAALLTAACGDGGAGGSSDAPSTGPGPTTTATTSATTGAVEPTSSSGAPTSTGTSSGDATDGTGASTSDGTGATTSGATTTGASTSEGGTSEGGSSEGGTSEGGGTSGQELRVLQLNLCHSGVAGCFTGDAVMKKAVEVIEDVAPGLATLNEMCRDDLPYLAAMTGAVDHRFTPALRADDTPVKCKNGDDYGIGLLSWFPPAWDAPVHGVYSTQSSMTERRVWICMGYAGFVGCTTHLSTHGPTAITQCHDLVDGPLSTAAADGPALMAGDWNLKYKGDPNAQACVPAGFYRKGDGSLQHVIASADLTFLETIVIDMDGTTDHPGLEVRMTLP